jgi:hypothetical protein
MRKLLLLLFATSCVAQVPVPQLNLTGNIGCQGFPCVNSGAMVLAFDANHTMTATETSAFSVKVTSSVSLTATRNLVYPAGRFFVTVENATTGGQALQVIGASGTGITIPNGQTVSVWNDGTNFVQVGASGLYPASGIANSTGSGWGTSYSTTGTGTVVALAASPALTGTPTAPTASLGANTTQVANTAFVQAALSSVFPSIYNCVFAATAITAGTSVNCTGSATGQASSVAIATWQGVPASLTVVAPLILNTYMSSGGAPAVSVYNPTGSTITVSATLNLQVVYQ